MNPKTIKTQLDKDKTRQQYLNSLRIEASNNQLNANANMILKQTGATPTQPTDFRTTTERYADLEGQKILLETRLRSITDGTSASQIVQALSPLELRFATGAFPYIQQELSQKYSLGVPAPIAVAFIRALQRKEELTNGVEFGIQQATGEGILLSANQILNYMPTEEQIEEILSILRNLQDTPMRRRVEQDIRVMREMTPSAEDLERLDDLPPDVRQEIYDELNGLLSEIPSREGFEAYSAGLERTMGDPRAVEQELIGIDSELYQEPRTVARTAQILQEIKRARPQPEAEEMSEMSATTTAPAVSTIASANWTDGRGGMSIEQKRAMIISTIQNNPDLQGETVQTATNRSFVIGRTPVSRIQTHADLDAVFRGIQQIQSSKSNIVTPAQTPREGEEAGEGRGMRGRGLAIPQQRVRRNRLEHLTEGVVEKPKPYIPFGRYVIHRYDLEKGKLSMKSPKGAGIKEIPSQKISLNLGGVLHSIGRGIMPDYDKVNSLKEEDKEILHRVIQHSRMTDKIKVPTPKSKTEEEKISDRFDILKGEIMAGNDNPKIVKELKTLLMKLIQSGRIPRKEAHDILTDLASIGI